MKTLKFLIMTLALLLSCGTMQAQFGKRLGKTVENAAKRTVERKAEQKTEEAVGKAIDKATDPESYKDRDGGKESNSDAKSSNSQKSSQNNDDNQSADDADGLPAAANPQQDVKAAEMAYAKSDFVPGDEIIFGDDLANEQVGEFPSQWDMISGNIEISKVNSENTIALFKNASITPLMKTPKNYLPDAFTIETDVYIGPVDSKLNTYINGNYRFQLQNNQGSEIAQIFFWGYARDGKLEVATTLKSTSGESRRISDNVPNIREGWHHLAISFNKRALKVYVDGYRIANAPNVAQGNWFVIETGQNGGKEATFWIKNIRIAQGAVPLYDRMMTDGKIITYGITFDVGKSTIKPESMGEINRIAKLMTDNPDLKFSVEGHTDSTGSEATNQKLSDERSAAVVAKLVETGISKDRLQSAGKGQSSPIADNASDEGRAKNRRVEFVKI
jgi:outer membrane protein OmpA-like peptidoglycan-associated protein